MPPLMGHFIQRPPLQPSDYGGGNGPRMLQILVTSTQTISKQLLDSVSSPAILSRSGFENLKTNSKLSDLLNPVKGVEVPGSGFLQPSSTLVPPECVTADSTNEFLRKICDAMGPDDRASTKDHIYVDSGWSVVIGGIICFAVLMLVLAMINKTIALNTKRGSTFKSMDRPSTCEEPFDNSYQNQFEKSLPPGEVKFQLGPGSDEDDWTDSWARSEYAPIVHYPIKKQKQPTYRTF